MGESHFPINGSINSSGLNLGLIAQRKLLLILDPSLIVQIFAAASREARCECVNWFRCRWNSSGGSCSDS